ncbi:patatin-like phospholipase family protein [Caldovatus aquaticus]|uniref:Patatin-like phospholipase family protein n=1 Tax=Caldovatus aquaticus TaxID=2865671 RepID=A0ABS7F6P9_9PROT|nr:patatin-like phospholipase family protein [Caldovatus aquaticus]MBW8271229.1 patatin-like phospholipase family protein [Caldovatus aquaticus]
MPATDAAILARLRQPLVTAPADATTFRLGIVLNGTVSAGAWTAGVLDFLIEALDAWEEAKRAGEDVPRHSVRLEILGGASGGGVCAALLARAATCRFRHARTAAGAPGNPFWDTWVERLDLAPMLGTADLADPAAPAASALDGQAIEQAARLILDWAPGATPGVAALDTPRAWLADPFRVLLTLTNLRGVPYAIDFAPPAPATPGAAPPPRASHHLDHADHALFAFPLRPGAPPADLRGDEWAVGPDFARDRADWARFAAYVRATSAFPGGFPPVRLERPAEHYRWRAALLPGWIGADGTLHPPRPRLRVPRWEALPPEHRPGPDGRYVFDCVDGGALNNQPVELVRLALAGLGRSLERDGRKASAAVLLIDPFAAAPRAPLPSAPPDLAALAGRLIGAWTAQARFATSDLLLALEDGVASRFLLTAGRQAPDGTTLWGGEALAGAGLGAFLGFLDRDLRVHDYLLGRRNCRDYLASHFVLPETNPLFGGLAARAPGVAREYRGRAPGTRLTIPVGAGPRAPLPPPAGPGAGRLGADVLESRLRARLRRVARRLAAGHGIGAPWAGLAARLVARKGAAAIARELRKGLATLERPG